MKNATIGVFGEKSIGKSTLISCITGSDSKERIYVSIDGPILFKFIEKEEPEKSEKIDLALIAYEEGNKNSFGFAEKIISSFPRNQKIGFIATKHDLHKQKTLDNTTEQNLIRESGSLFIIKTSALTNYGIDSLLYNIAEYTIEHPNIIYDQKNIIRKFNKYIELFKPKRIVSFNAATETKWCKKAHPSHVKPTDEKDYEWEEFNNKETLEFGRTQGDWFAFKGKVQIPEIYNKEKHFLRLKFHVCRNYACRPWDDDFPAGPEGRVWLNGKNIGAIDEFHDGHVIKDELVQNGEMEVTLFTCRCFAEHSLSQFGIEVVDKNTEALYYRLSFISNLLKQMKEDNPDRIKIIRLADAAVRELDIRDLNGPIPLLPVRKQDPSNDAFYASTQKALDILRSIRTLRADKPEEDGPTTSIIGYSHLDTCWEWPYTIIHFKSANTASSMLHLMENPPEEFENPVQWKFLATAAQHYVWMQEDEPELFNRVIEAAKNGRWDIDGISWLEHDTTLPCGESIIRQMLLGIKYFEGKLGFKQSTLILPDCFGFSAALPQIIRGFGLDSFITSKISWCEYNEFPYSTFKWRGIDGSDVLSHFITTPSTWSYQTSTYTGTATVREIVETFNCYKEKDINRNAALHTAGNGDGGGGITEDMIWNMNLFAELPRIQGVTKVKFPSVSELFKEIRRNSDSLPVWDDELYLEYHRGTLTSQEAVKTQNRRLENSLHNAEFILTVLAALYGVDTKKYTQEIENVWHETLLFQFHDAIPGTSINEANHQILTRGKAALSKIREIERELAEKLSEHIGGKILINTIAKESFAGDKVAPSYGWASCNDAKTEKVTTEFYLRNPANEDFTVEKIEYESIDTTVCSPFSFNGKTVTTSDLEITFNEFGGFQSVKSIKTGREFIAQDNNKAPQLSLFEDRSINWPAWDIQLYHKEMQLESPKLIKLECINDAIVMDYEIPIISEESKSEKTTIKQVMTFNGEIIDIKTYVHWTQHDKLLKYVLPTTIRSREARFGIQFGHISRPTHANTSRDMARFEASGRWSDLSDATGGVSLMSDVKCGFDVHGQTMMMSLLKAPMQTDKWCDFGDRRFVIRLNFHSEPFNTKIQKLSDSLITKPILAGNKQAEAQISQSFVTLSNNDVILETLKPAEEGENCFIARLYEPTGGWQKTTVSFPLLSNKYKATKTNLNEKEEYEIESVGDNSFQIELKPFEIFTMKLQKK